MENGKKKARVLIYTGDSDLAKSLTLLLQDQYKIHTTRLLAKATEMVERREVDLFVADLGLSLESGLQAVDQIRSKDGEIPIVVFCSYQLRGMKLEREIRERVNALFHVPVNVEEIVKTIAQLLQTQEQNLPIVPTHTR
jgi:DNA-binding NtrC family response regulator